MSDIPMDDFRGQRLLSFKEIDALHGWPKGTAFRVFKQQALIEGEHYYYLPAATHGETIEALRRAGRIYGSTVNAILLTEVGYALLCQPDQTMLTANQPP